MHKTRFALLSVYILVSIFFQQRLYAKSGYYVGKAKVSKSNPRGKASPNNKSPKVPIELLTNNIYPESESFSYIIHLKVSTLTIQG